VTVPRLDNAGRRTGHIAIAPRSGGAVATRGSYYGTGRGHGIDRYDARTGLLIGSAADRAASGLHSGRPGHGGPRLDLTLGRHGHRYSGFIHIGGRPGNLNVNGVVFRHPNRHGHHGHYGPYPYPRGDYYRNYPIVSFRPHYRGYYWGDPIWYYGYSYSCVYYDQPVVYRLQTPTVVYVQPDPIYVESQSTPVVIQSDSSSEVGPPAPDAGDNGSLFFPAQPDGSADQGATEYQTLDEVPQTIVQKGTAAYMAGDYENAQRYFIEAVMADERDGYAKLLYSFSMFAQKDYDLSALTLRRALLTSDELVDQPPDLRTLYTDPDVFHDQLSALIKHLEHHSDDNDARFLLGYVYYATGRPVEAAEQFQKVAAADSKDKLASQLYETASSIEKVQQ